MRGGACGRTVEIGFAHKTSCSPRVAGLSDDARQLAIFLHRIEIQRVPLRERLREIFGLGSGAVTAWRGDQRAPAE
jgi:hypothetical protein